MNLLELRAGVFDRLRRRFHVIKVGTPGCLLNQLLRGVLPPEFRLPGVDAASENLVKGLLRLLSLLLRYLQVVISDVLMVEYVFFGVPIAVVFLGRFTRGEVLRDLELVHGAEALLERGLEEFFALVLLGDAGVLGFGVHGLVLLEALLDVLLVGDEAGADLHLPVGGREFDGVADEVHEDLREARLVDLHRIRHVLPDHELDIHFFLLGLPGKEAHRLGHGLHHVVHVVV
jgi:hypothetical protein